MIAKILIFISIFFITRKVMIHYLSKKILEIISK